jgi:hypothetical protein
VKGELKMKYMGDSCSECKRDRPFRTGIDGEGKLYAYFSVCLCDKICQTEQALSLYSVLQGKREEEKKEN